MQRRNFIKLMAGTAFLGAGGCSMNLGREDGAVRNRPNVILFLTDDQGYSDVGFNGNKIVKTPNIDKFASQGTVFDRCYVCPVCSPTRASLMTGRYHFRTGVLDTQGGVSMLKPGEVTIAEALKSAGYKTGMFGKWHLGDNCPTRPIDQGFDHSLTHVGGMIGAPYNPLDANSYFEPVLLEDGIEKKFSGYCCDIFADAAIDFIDANKNDPFFIYLAPNTPHHPLTVPEKYAEPYKKAGLSEETSRFYGMITNIDDNFKKLTDKLKSLNILDNTVIIFLGDNGTSSLHKQDDLWECGLRGRKTYVYENGIRVPMFICMSNNMKAGLRVNDICDGIDIMPTILDLCDVQKPAKVNFDGITLAPFIRDDKAKLPDRNVYIQWHRGAKPDKYRNFAVITDKYKLVQSGGRAGLDFDASEIKYELYDIKEDPFEKNDISDEHPHIVARLKSDYDRWYESVVAASNFTPTRIFIGSECENPVMLTRQDWQGGGLFDGDYGFYDLDIKTSGDYRITCRLTDMLHETHTVTLKIDDQVYKKDILYAESQCRFDSIELQEGPASLEAWVDMDGKKYGFRFITIEKL
ncbi:MAG: arylsulfatase [Sedimentisphaeraceae bacterium JB056]